MKERAVIVRFFLFRLDKIYHMIFCRSQICKWFGTIWLSTVLCTSVFGKELPKRCIKLIEPSQSDSSIVPGAFIEWPDTEPKSVYSGDKLPEYKNGHSGLKEDLLKELSELFIEYDRHQKSAFESKLSICMDVDSIGKTSGHFTIYQYGRDELTDSCILEFFKNVNFQKPAHRDSKAISIKLSIPILIQYPGNAFSVEPLYYPQGDSIWIYRIPLSNCDSLKKSISDTTLYYFTIKLNESGEIKEYKLKNIVGTKKRNELLYSKRIIKSIHHFKNPNFEAIDEGTKRILLFRFENNRIQTVVMRPGPQF